MKCEHGCGQEARFKSKYGKNSCSENSGGCPEIKRRISESTKERHKLGIISSFSKEAQIKSNEVRINRLKQAPFETLGKRLRKSVVLEEQNNCCLHCNNSEWLGLPIKFELDHIDGNNKNNKRENVRMLCPNCHSQTDTYKIKNKK